MKRNIIGTVAAIASIVISASSALAHGGMASPDELGRPLATAAGLAFVSYWTVILWPSRKTNGRANAGSAPKSASRRRNRTRRGATSGSRGDVLKALGKGRDG